MDQRVLGVHAYVSREHSPSKQCSRVIRVIVISGVGESQPAKDG